jgi:mRNA interferase MazF
VDLVTDKKVLRGDVWLSRFDPTIGSEICKTRPCLIVSPNLMNRHLRTVTVMPLTSGSREEPFRLATRFGDRSGFFLGDQLRTLSKLRLIKMVGRVDETTLSSALMVLRNMFTEEQ